MQFLLQVSLLSGLLLLSQIGKRSELFLVVGADFIGVLQILGLVLLPFVSFVFPTGFLFAVLLAFRKLTMDGEWYAMQASGYSVARAAFLVTSLATVLAASCLFVAHVAEPWGLRKIEKILFEGAQKRWDSVLGQTMQAGVFETSIPQWMVYAGFISEDRSSFRDFILAPQKAEPGKSVRLYAPRAELKGQIKNADLTLELYEGRFLRFQNDEQIAIGFDKMSLPLGTILKESFTKTGDAPRKKIQILSTPELRKYIQRKKSELKPGKKSKRLSRAMTTLALRTGVGLTIIPLSLFGLIAGLVRRRSSRNSSYFWIIGALLLCFGSLASIAPLQKVFPLETETLVVAVLGCITFFAMWVCFQRNQKAPKSA